MFEIRRAGAKGLGVFASRPIARGSRILAERALLSIDRHNPNILTAARRLSPSEQESLLRLSLNESRRSHVLGLLSAVWQARPFRAGELGRARLHRSRAVLDVFYNNNFALADERGTRAVFPTVARLNHSCVPNSQGNLHAGLGGFAVHATRDIPPGEEITISYLHDQLGLRAARQAKLHEGYGFHCACELCAGNARRLEESHGRRSEMQARLRAFAEQHRQRPAHGSQEAATARLALTRLSIDTHEQEGLAGRELASLYAAAAGLAVRLGDQALATMLGAKGLELEKDAVGVDSPFYQASLLAFTHMSFEKEEPIPILQDDTPPELSYAPWT